MIILLQFDLDDKTVETIKSMDLHGDDEADMINETAVFKNNLHGVWHFHDSAVLKIDSVLRQLFDESYKENRECQSN